MAVIGRFLASCEEAAGLGCGAVPGEGAWCWDLGNKRWGVGGEAAASGAGEAPSPAETSLCNSCDPGASEVEGITVFSSVTHDVKDPDPQHV